MSDTLNEAVDKSSKLDTPLNLIALAFTTLLAGVGLLQVYFSALGLSLATWNCSLVGVAEVCLSSPSRPEIVAKVNLWFPIGQFLIAFGLSIVTFVGFRIVKPRIFPFVKDRRLILYILAIATFLSPIWLPNPTNIGTVRMILDTVFLQHWDVYFEFLAIWLFFIGLVKSKSKIKYGIILFAVGQAFAVSLWAFLTYVWRS